LFLASLELSKTVFLTYRHPVMSYGIIYWENLAKNIKVFLLQKRRIIIMACTQRSESRIDLFKRFFILMLASNFIFVLMTFIVHMYEIFQPSSEGYKVSTRHGNNLHRPVTNITVY